MSQKRKLRRIEPKKEPRLPRQAPKREPRPYKPRYDGLEPYEQDEDDFARALSRVDQLHLYKDW
jgi:hypothetical protein